MRVKAWHNGKPQLSGSGYGLKVLKADRDQLFDRDWDHVDLELPGRLPIKVPLYPSFWVGSRELRSAKIGSWLIENGLAPWKRGSPPSVELISLGDTRFVVRETQRVLAP